MKIPEFLSLVVIIALVVNMVLLGLGKISVFLFFIVLGIGALIAYKGIPWLREL